MWPESQKKRKLCSPKQKKKKRKKASHRFGLWRASTRCRVHTRQSFGSVSRFEKKNHLSFHQRIFSSWVDFVVTDDGQTRTIDCCRVVLLVCLMGLRAVPDDHNEVPTTEWAFIKWWSNGFACAIGTLTHTHMHCSTTTNLCTVLPKVQFKQIISISSSLCCNASSNDLVQRNGNIQCHVGYYRKEETTSADCHIMFSCHVGGGNGGCGDITLN